MCVWVRINKQYTESNEQIWVKNKAEYVIGIEKSILFVQIQWILDYSIAIFMDDIKNYYASEFQKQ